MKAPNNGIRLRRIVVRGPFWILLYSNDLWTNGVESKPRPEGAPFGWPKPLRRVWRARLNEYGQKVLGPNRPTNDYWADNAHNAKLDRINAWGIGWLSDVHYQEADQR